MVGWFVFLSLVFFFLIFFYYYFPWFFWSALFLPFSTSASSFPYLPWLRKQALFPDIQRNMKVQGNSIFCFPSWLRFTDLHKKGTCSQRVRSHPPEELGNSPGNNWDLIIMGILLDLFCWLQECRMGDCDKYILLRVKNTSGWSWQLCRWVSELQICKV